MFVGSFDCVEHEMVMILTINNDELQYTINCNENVVVSLDADNADNDDDVDSDILTFMDVMGRDCWPNM